MIIKTQTSHLILTAGQELRSAVTIVTRPITCKDIFYHRDNIWPDEVGFRDWCLKNRDDSAQLPAKIHSTRDSIWREEVVV